MNCEKEFEKFCDEVQLPTMSQFITRIECLAAREKATFEAGFNSGIKITRKQTLEEAAMTARFVVSTAQDASDAILQRIEDIPK